MLIYSKSNKVELSIPIREIKCFENLIIKPLDGTMTIHNAKLQKIISGEIYFEDVELDFPSVATPETKFNLFEISAFATHQEKFYSISENLYSLCLTQHQIVEICTEYRKLFFVENENIIGLPITIFFLFNPSEYYQLVRPEEDNKFLVACISLKSRKLISHIEDFTSDERGDKQILNRFVVRKDL